jgi:hypothetical protein
VIANFCHFGPVGAGGGQYQQVEAETEMARLRVIHHVLETLLAVGVPVWQFGDGG